MHNWHDLFEYKNGKLHWKIKPANRVKIGDEVGHLSAGYRRFEYKNQQYHVHRVIWEMHKGPIGSGLEVDHINHIKNDNRIENLRLISHAENTRNKSIAANNTSGISGVHWNKRLNKWHVQITANGVRKHVGLFNSMEDAITAREQAKSLFGYHKNHGI